MFKDVVKDVLRLRVRVLLSALAVKFVSIALSNRVAMSAKEWYVVAVTV